MSASFAGMVGNRNKQRSNNASEKKMTIKTNLKRAPKLKEGFVEVNWGKLKAAITAIHEKEAVPQSLEELFRIVENLASQGQADLLYARVKQMCDDHIHAELLRLSQAASVDSVKFLSQILAVWKDHFNQMLLIRLVFLYLDRLFVTMRSTVVEGQQVMSLFDLGLHLFRQHLDSFPEIARKTISGILRQIESERQGGTIDQNQIYELLRMLDSLHLYEAEFQPLFLEESKKFYNEEGIRKLQSSDTPAYLQHCSKRLSEELERCQHYLGPSSKAPLVACLEQQLIDDHLAAILEQGFPSMMKEHRVDDLARLHILSDRVNRLPDVKKAFLTDIRKVGEALVMDPQKDAQMIESLLSMKLKLDEVVTSAFKGEAAFENALKDSFEAFINQRSNKPAELVAKYVDSELKSGSKGKSEEELEANLENALMLFRFLSGKDVFEAFYKKDLAKRLLLGRSASSDAEKVMITKLKAECGSQFTSKLEGMFKDMDLSKDFMMSFKQSGSAQRRLPSGLDLSVNVLTTGNWPSEALIPATLPEELAQCAQIFSEFYLSKHSGRRLVWHNTLGTCILKAQFNKGAKELVVSLFQSIVLMLFNEAEKLTYRDIKEQSGIDSDKELERTLQSLALGKSRVLIKEPKTKEVGPDDVFTFNAGFSASLYRVRINTIQLKETTEENTKTNEQVIQDRQYQIDAAIVRTMKMRKTLSHKLLMNELMQMLKFPIGTPDLKKRVESLIEREFLERDPSNSSVYNYLA